MTTPPAWMQKHPCASCATGYGFCAQYALSGLKCCKDCAHPTRWLPDPWTSADVVEMWEGKDMPEMVAKSLKRLQEREAQQP